MCVCVYVIVLLLFAEALVLSRHRLQQYWLVLLGASAAIRRRPPLGDSAAFGGFGIVAIAPERAVNMAVMNRRPRYTYSAMRLEQCVLSGRLACIGQARKQLPRVRRNNETPPFKPI